MRQRQTITHLASFFLPIVLMGAVFALLGVHPFGEKTLLILDMNSEYIAYYSQIQRSLLTGESLMRSWNMGMGLNMLGLVAFYTASPFLSLLAVFPAGSLTEAVLVITLLKFGLCGLTFSYYARYTFDLRGAANLSFSVAWALTAYNVVYSSNLMWLDGTAFLPLVLLGVEQLLREGRCKLFIASLVYVFLTSYYIGYMVGLFSFLYLTAVYFSRERSPRMYLRKLGRYLLGAALAAGLCAFLLLPAYLNLRSGQNSMWEVPLRPDFHFTLGKLTSKFIPGAYDSLTDSGSPNLYCTLLAVLLALAFFASRGVGRREKIVFGALTGFLMVSLSCEVLDLGWHAFEDPTWYPARYSFVVSFLVLYLAVRGYGQLHRLSLPSGICCVLFLLIILAEAGIAGYPNAATGLLAICAVLVLVYGALLWSKDFRRRPVPPRWAALLLAALLCCESFWGAYLLAVRTDGQFQYKTRESYTGYRETYLPAVEAVRSLDPGAFRMEIVEQRSANGGLALGYPGISHYSTTTDQQLNEFLTGLSYNRGTINELRFAATTPITNGILGIRYVLSKEELGEGYRLVEMSGEVGIYENLCAYPLAFAAGGEALGFSGRSGDPFVLAEEYVRATAGGEPPEPLFESLEWMQILTNTYAAARSGYTEYRRRDGGEGAWVSYRVFNDTGDTAYAYFPVGGRLSDARLFVNGRDRGRELAYRHNTIVELGGEDESRLDLMVDPDKDKMSYYTPYVYSLNMDAALSAAASARERAMEISVFTDTRVAGTVTAPAQGVLVTTFPYDEGWRVTVDGRRAEIKRFSQVFLAVELPEGTHQIEMRYRTPGLLPGAAVSALCAAGTLLYLLLERRRARIRRHQ